MAYLKMVELLGKMYKLNEKKVVFAIDCPDEEF